MGFKRRRARFGCKRNRIRTPFEFYWVTIFADSRGFWIRQITANARSSARRTIAALG
jgi:hypothetical protein